MTQLPLYLQISEMLIREIQAGRYLEGERLPPEREMAAQLDISVGTLRKSLADLTEKGMLDRIQGSGNYIKHGQAQTSVYAFFRLELIDGGGLPTAEIVSVDLLDKPAEFPEFGTGRAYRIRRFRRIGGKPAALEEIWFDAAFGVVEEGDISESLYLYYREALGIWIQRAEDRLGVGSAPNWGSGFLSDRAGPLGHINRVSRDQKDRLVEVSRTWFDPQVVHYVSRLR